MKENNNGLEGLGKKQKVFIMLQQIDWTGCIISFEPPHEKRPVLGVILPGPTQTGLYM